MRVEQAHARTERKNLLVSALIDLALVIAALLSMRSAPAQPAAPYIEARPGAAAVISATPGEAVADRDTLDLQLD
ncbi:MAG TPA: hypothetical protein VLJ18_03325 [Thermoanaerobaculia bacterium]|nr:hypothetical protein [Thermoanaerobaculia bacterium]